MLAASTRREFLQAAAASMAPARVASPVPLLTVLPNRVLTYGESRLPCVIGRGGISSHKREGDGATPAGRFPLRRVLFRPDRIARVQSGLPVRPIVPQDGWCTDPGDPSYNQQITLPRAGQHEDLWRDDALYDLIVVIGYNDSPAVPGDGSAIFLHVARPGMLVTDGCIAVPLQALLEIVRYCGSITLIAIQP
jgi:L,D-peptidoglycan transpeptidase YkuD (ErfK/YbiS/YcfS/YnhG family)